MEFSPHWGLKVENRNWYVIFVHLVPIFLIQSEILPGMETVRLLLIS